MKAGIRASPIIGKRYTLKDSAKLSKRQRFISFWSMTSDIRGTFNEPSLLR